MITRSWPNLGGEVWKEQALRLCRMRRRRLCLFGEVTSFPRVPRQAKDDEIVVFSWIVYESRQSRDAVMAKVMADPRLTPDLGSMPFDMKRMIFRRLSNPSWSFE